VRRAQREERRRGGGDHRRGGTYGAVTVSTQMAGAVSTSVSAAATRPTGTGWPSSAGCTSSAPASTTSRGSTTSCGSGRRQGDPGGSVVLREPRGRPGAPQRRNEIPPSPDMTPEGPGRGRARSTSRSGTPSGSPRV
jgi:hypothetical protein